MLARDENMMRQASRSDVPRVAFDTPGTKLLADGALGRILDLECGGSVEDILQSALIEPIEGLTCSPGKRVRGKLVQLAFRLVSERTPLSLSDARHCENCAEDVAFLD